MAHAEKDRNKKPREKEMKSQSSSTMPGIVSLLIECFL